jgi:hypothetical protein
MYRRVRALGGTPRRDAVEPGLLLGRKVRGDAGEDRQSSVGAMHSDDPVGVIQRKVTADVTADVAARRTEPLVAEEVHQLRPQARDGDGVERRPMRVIGVAKARNVGHDHVERVGGVGTVRAGVNEERDDFGVAPERIRPTMAEDQRQYRPGGRNCPGVHEVDPEPAEPNAEAGQPGERRFLGQPVEAVRPVGDELPEVGDVGAQ